jgi:CCR4-NOT transcription complex subunit 6
LLQQQPVESVSTRTTAYIRGLGPVESNSAQWTWERSSLSVACMNQMCPYNNTTATVECVCFDKKYRFCTPHCLKMSWKDMQSTLTAKSINSIEKRKQKKNEGKDNEETVLESDQDVEDRVLAGDSMEWPESKWGKDMTYEQVASTRSYTPTSEDVGRLLRLNVNVTDQNLKQLIETEMVIPMPPPAPDRRVIVNPNPPPRQQLIGSESIRVVTYNLLAAIYATQVQYPYCPAWALSWNFRKGQIFRELAGYQADVLCLQEVQADHFESFLYPQLAAIGYEGLYKQKTREALGPRGRIDGCALFFKVAKFELKEKYVIEFNEAAMTMAQQGTFKGISAEEAKNPSLGRGSSKTHGVSRLLKDNVAQIAVLELRDTYGQYSYLDHPPRICISNVHLFWDPAFADIKLWQAHILIKELQKFTQARGLPLILGGDFNSEPKSSVHELLSSASVRPNHPDLLKDIVGVLPSTNKLTHTLPLRSAYAIVRGGQEPPFTNYTGHYVGTLDYIWFTADRLVPMAVLDTYTKEEMVATLEKDIALPAPQFPSDHLSLCCDFVLLDPRGRN